MGEDLTRKLAPVAHQQLVEEEVHQVHVPRVPDGLVIEVLDHTVIRLTHRAEPARGGEGLELLAVDVDGLLPFHRRDELAHPVLDHLTVVEVLVDHPLGRPVEGISEQAGGVLGEGADPHAHRAAAVELRYLGGGDDADESWSEAALGGHQPLGGGAHLYHRSRRGDVLGEVEVVQTELERGLGYAEVEVVWQTRQHRLDPAQFAAQHLYRRQVGHPHREGGRAMRRADIEADDLEPGLVEQFGGQHAHLAEPQHSDSIKRHGFHSGTFRPRILP